ncbi:MAG TPA: DUF72 domain-containing protein [Acidimicrobiales bacterium]|nr:DUF72 domain-containing protein [Acidimicrobiales bacterium]
MGVVRVGTSGWSYPAWVGPFYPERTSAARMLGAYASVFDTVEAHATYRRLPAATALAKWVATVPACFRFACKAHMGISHRRDLDGVEDRVSAFLAAISPLAHTRGPVLVALPHQQPDLDRLGRIVDALGGGAFELGPAWERTDVLDRLGAGGATMVVTDSAERPAGAIPSVGPVAYVRLRRAEYPPGDLDLWAERLAKVAAEDRDAYVFLKHDDDATGPRLARELVARLG